MSLSFVTANNSYLRVNSPNTAAPITFGFWFNILDTNVENMAWFGDSGGTATFGIYKDGTNFHLYAGGAGSNVAYGDASVLGWHFLIQRVMSTTNYRAAILNPLGAIAHAAGTGNATFDFTTLTLGNNSSSPTSGLTGNIAELFYTDTDIQPDGLQLDETLLRRLAYRGPFSVPSLKKDIIEYRSFFSRTVNDKAGDVYYGKYGKQTWANTNGVTIGPHPPWAMPWNRRYIRPKQNDRAVSLFIPDIIASIGAALTGTAASGTTEAHIVSGGRTIILTLTGDTFIAAGAAFNAVRQAIIDGLDSAQSEAHGWDAVVKAGLAVTDVVRTSDTVVTVALPAFASYDITAPETITATVPAAALTGGVALVAAPTFSIAQTVAAALSGSILTTHAADIVAGGRQIILDLDSDTWVTAGATFNGQRQNIINGLDSAQAEAHGWDAEVKAKIAVTDVVRTSDTRVTITLDAEAAYAITATETITATIPGTALTGGNAVVATPTFNVYVDPTPSAGRHGKHKGLGLGIQL
jgi:hypothetical protein